MERNVANPRFELLASLGVFLRPGFLDPELCRMLRREIADAPGDPTTVNTGDASAEERQRRLKTVMLTERTALDVKGRLVALVPELEGHFGMDLGPIRTPHALCYRDGDFLQAHYDRSATAEEQWVRERKVSIVMFVNGSADTSGPETFVGGDLVLYGLMGGGDDRRFGIPIAGDSGMLVAFDSGVLHEVTEVTAGERQSVVAFCT